MLESKLKTVVKNSYHNYIEKANLLADSRVCLCRWNTCTSIKLGLFFFFITFELADGSFAATSPTVCWNVCSSLRWVGEVVAVRRIPDISDSELQVGGGHDVIFPLGRM